MAAIDPTVLASRKQTQDFINLGLQKLGPCPSHLKEVTLQVPLSDGTSRRTILVFPANTASTTRNSPLIILYHGGSWTTGSPEFILCSARAFASLLGAIVACPSYKYIPENPFPAPMHSAWDITAWLSYPENLNAGPLKDEQVVFDPKAGLVLGGVSAGAELAAVIAGISADIAADKTSKLAEGRGEIKQPIKGVFLSIPILLQEDMVPAEYVPLWTSRVEHANAPVISAKGLAETQARLKADHHSPWFSPMNLDLARISGHHAPRVYVQAGQLDILRDDAVVYAKAFKDKQVAEVHLDVIQDVDHVGWVTLPVPAAHSDELRTKWLDGMAWLLEAKWDKNQNLPY